MLVFQVEGRIKRHSRDSKFDIHAYTCRRLYATGAVFLPRGVTHPPWSMVELGPASGGPSEYTGPYAGYGVLATL